VKSLKLSASLGIACAGCGAGSPLLHPAHPLAEGEIGASLGASTHFAPSEAQAAMDETSVMLGQGQPVDENLLTKGALAQALSSPGLAPYAAGRVGITGDNEAGLSYTGRRARVDLRHAFVFDELALSIGGGITGIMPNVGSDPPNDPCDDPKVCPDPIVDDSYSEIPGLDAGSVSGWGVDLPLLFGWRSQPALFAFWAGVRARYESMSADFRFSLPEGPRTARGSGSRSSLGAVVGISVGVKPVTAALEFSPAFERLEGDLTLPDGSVGMRLEGFSYSPAFSLTYTY